MEFIGTIMTSINFSKIHVIKNINPEEFKILTPYMKYLDFKPGELSEQRNPNEFLMYFVLSGIFALTIQVDKLDKAFVLLGHDFMLDCSMPYDNGMDVIRIRCLSPLTTYALPAHIAQTLLPNLPSFQKALATANRNLFMKIARATACSQTHTSNQRLAQWLLRASDLSENPRIAISHQVLAQLLGIWRAGATAELAKLKASNAISTGYGWIEIKDRHALEQHACSCYQAHSVVFKP